MPAKQFIYAPINPIPLLPPANFPAQYNTVPFDYYLFPNQIPYAQKYQTTDVVTLQCLSDWVPTLKIRDDLGIVRQTINPVTPANGILNQTYTLYQFEIDWNVLGAGIWFPEISYTDDTPTLQVWSIGQYDANGRPMRYVVVQDVHEGTLLFEYTNSRNDFSAIFNPTDIVFRLRVEGQIAEYSPVSDDIIYTDQEYNVTKLSAIPRREFNLYVGSNLGLEVYRNG